MIIFCLESHTLIILHLLFCFQLRMPRDYDSSNLDADFRRPNTCEEMMPSPARTSDDANSESTYKTARLFCLNEYLM